MPELIKYIPFNQDIDTNTPSVVCLGNFDGVHLGHMALIDNALKIKAALSIGQRRVRAAVLCFDTLSSDHLNKCKVPHILSFEQKLELFRRAGLDGTYVCGFSEIKNLTPREFIEEILMGKCLCISAVCGFNFRFGKGAVGNAELLQKIFQHKFGSDNSCSVVPPVMLEETVISSSQIRLSLINGDVECAQKMLGRPFSISHPVVHGKHLGTSLGFPTLNHIFSDDELIPSFGIYATKSLINGKEYVSVTNIGVRPTVSTSQLVTCETHLIDIEDNSRSFYGDEAEIFFYHKLRDEQRFDSTEQLSQAIALDVKAAKKYFQIKKT